MRMDEDRENLSNDTCDCYSKTPEMFQCSFCEFKTNLKVDLTEHFQVFHEGKENNKELNNIFKSIRCKNCDFETHSVLILTNHSNTCKAALGSESINGWNWLQCEQCAHKTKRKSDLKRHVVLKHMNPKEIQWFKCDRCVHTAKIKSDLKRHVIAKHMNPKNIKWFKCDQCTYVAKTKSLVKKHAERKHLGPQDKNRSGQPVYKSKINRVSVQSLLATPFSSLSPADKTEIKKLGRPTPHLNIKQSVTTKHRTYNRTFNSDVYKKHSWICGCDVKNALFCFPCLLFGGEKLWAKKGFSDLNHLPDRIRKHSLSATHMKNVVQFSFIGNVNIATQLDTAYRQSIGLHNEKVRHNRHVLNNIINCVRFCGAFELAMREHEADSSNSVLNGLINFSSTLSAALKEHLEQADVFKGTSKTTQDEILQTMFEVCQEEIAKEVQEADYLSIIVDETSDVSDIFQVAIILRYITKGKPVERFWDLINPPAHDAPTLASCILTELDKHLRNNTQKLIAQTYNGPSVMSKLQGLVRRSYEHAAYVHCYAHRSDLVMLNAASINSNVRIFFANLQGICDFFSNNQHRAAILDEIVGKRAHSASPSWNFSSRSICIVFEHLEEITESIRRILNESKNVNVIAQASGYIKIITSESFVSWLDLFYKVMPHVELLFARFQTREIDPVNVKTFVTSFEDQILSIRDHADVNETKEVCDIIISQAKDRFSFTGHLIAATLFFSDKFGQYNSCFPESNFKETVMVYRLFDVNKFRTELSVIYAAKGFRSVSGLLVLHDYISQNCELSETFSETLKLLKVLITIPMCSTEADRCFSTLDRIKTFLRNTVSGERLSALAMLSKERDLIENVPTFNQRVIEKFAAAKDRGADFQFK